MVLSANSTGQRNPISFRALYFITYGWMKKFRIPAFQVENEVQLKLFQDKTGTVQDTTPIRDYINVWDLADLHELGLRFLADDGVSNAFNAGTGAGNSIKQVVDAVRKFTKKELPVYSGKRKRRRTQPSYCRF